MSFMPKSTTYQDLIISDKSLKDIKVTDGRYVNTHILNSSIDGFEADSIQVKGVVAEKATIKNTSFGNNILTHFLFGPLSKVDWAYIYKVRIDTAFAMLSSTIKRSIIYNTTITNGTLSDSHFKRVAFINTLFVDCKFSNVAFSVCSFTGCAFVKCRFEGLKDIKGPFISCDFTPKKALGPMLFCEGQYPDLAEITAVGNQLIRCTSDGKIMLLKCYNNEGITAYTRDIPPWAHKVYDFSQEETHLHVGTDFTIIPRKLAPNNNFKVIPRKSSRPEKNHKKAYRFCTVGV